MYRGTISFDDMLCIEVKEDSMIKRHAQTACLVVALVFLSLTGCKKHVAASTPAPAPVAAAPAPPAPTITLRATPATLDRGQSGTLQWETKNATSVDIQPALGSVANTGTRTIAPASSVTYVATAKGPGGTSSDSARITVRVPAAPAASRPNTRTPNVSVGDLFRQNVQPIYFDYDKAEIRPDQVSRLSADAAWLKEHPGVKFTVEGNCDDRGSEEYNLALGDRRAAVVRDFLLKEGVPQASMMTVSYGEERPVCRDEDESCYQKNRRAAFSMSTGG
jgi:peptidoglycan-associated lipoprotein